MKLKDETSAAGAVDDRIPRKDRWALILSGIAIGVSFVTFWDTHRASERQEKVAERQEKVAERQEKLSERQAQLADEKTYRWLKTTHAVFVYSADPSLSSVTLTFENVGELPITISRAAIQFETAYALKMPNDNCVDDLNRGFFEAEQKDQKSTELKGGGSAFIQFKWPKSCPSWIPGIRVNVTYFGEDEFKSEDPGIKVEDGSKGISLPKD